MLVIVFFSKQLLTGSPVTKRNLSIKIIPLSMFDPGPRYRIGLEYISDKQLGYTVDIGYGNHTLNRWRFSDKNRVYSLFEIRPEIKYLFLRHRNHFLYGAIEGFYINENKILGSGHYQRENADFEIRFDRAKFRRQKYGARLKLGLNLSVFERFSLDVYGGFGVAHRNISYY